MSIVDSWRSIERRQEALDLCFFRYLAVLRSLNEVTASQYNVAGQLSLEVGHCLSVLRRLTELAAEDRRALDAKVRFRRDHEAWMLTEAFYMFAWRALERVSERAKPNPKKCFGLRRREARGIREIRNDFLQHVGEVGFNTPNVLWSDAASGPILKAIRSDYQQRHLPLDKGLFINAAEFQDVLSDALDAFFAAHDSRPCAMPPFTPATADYAEILGPPYAHERDDVTGA